MIRNGDDSSSVEGGGVAQTLTRSTGNNIAVNITVNINVKDTAETNIFDGLVNKICNKILRNKEIKQLSEKESLYLETVVKDALTGTYAQLTENIEENND